MPITFPPIPGSPGTPGAAATIRVNSTTTGSAGTQAAVSNSGTSSSASLDFTIPKGSDGTNGTNGTAATIVVHSVTTTTAGAPASITNIGTSGAASLDFVIPAGQNGINGAGLIIQKLTGVLGTGGQSTVTFSPAFSSTPTVFEGQAWNGNQGTYSYATAVSATSITLKCKRSRGTLLLSAGPFEDAQAGDPYTIFAIGT